MLEILTGDCRQTLKTIEDGTVQCCVTSPPYWGLRDYGTATWEGGDPDCDHLADRSAYEKNFADSKQASNKGTGNRDIIGHDKCPKCGAKRIDSQIGLEENYQDYVDTMVELFGEVKRVLRDDGTLWLNIGDSYAGNCSRTSSGRQGMGDKREGIYAKGGQGLKPKDLVGIPWRVAFALQADGWYLRQDIIWHKPNPMPESVTDRCTKSHEYIFLLSKSPKYYYDAESIREACSPENIDDFKRRKKKDNKGKGDGTYEEARPDLCRERDAYMPDDFRRNKRDVWTVATKPYKDAHFATFPEDLITPCIMAGSKGGDTVLDPFGGSGTTGRVAIENGRKAILCELNPEYVELINKRTTTTMGFGF